LSFIVKFLNEYKTVTKLAVIYVRMFLDCIHVVSE